MYNHQNQQECSDHAQAPASAPPGISVIAASPAEQYHQKNNEQQHRKSPFDLWIFSLARLARAVLNGTRQFTRVSRSRASSSRARINSFRILNSHPGLRRTRTSEMDSATMRHGIGTRHCRMATSKTTGLPNQDEYPSGMSLVP